MKILLGCFGIFLATIFFLSIEVKDRPLFSHIYKVISPATKAVQSGTESLFGSSVDKTKHYSKKLFDNSNPRFGDSVKSNMSGIKKKGDPQEVITVDEKQELDELIKSHD